MTDEKRLHLEIGMRVRASHQIERGGESGRREWGRISSPDPSVEGFVVGTRILSNGTIESHSESDDLGGRLYTWNEYVRDPGSAIRAVIIAPSIRSKHVLVFEEDIEVITDAD